jgi:hypothetical protein
MTIRHAALVLIGLFFPVTAHARPGDSDLMEHVQVVNGTTAGRTVHSSLATGVLGAASQDTAWFGGTVWAADSARWEAIPGGTWTFDSGVGSSYDYSIPGVNPFKYGSPQNPAPPGEALHATMEGWIGWDITYSEVTYFRRLTAADFSGTPCVGATVGLGGDASLWCGLLSQETAELCYVSGGPGYGNNWKVCLGQTFTLTGAATVTVAFDYVNDTEYSYDFSYVRVDTTGNGSAPDLELASYNGAVPASHAMLNLVPGATLRSDPGPFTLKFCVESDGSYSDEDGFYPTSCGAFAVDNVSVSGGGVNDYQDFESGSGGWNLLPANPGPGGDWSDIVAAADLPPVEPVCSCVLADSVLVFRDRLDPEHNLAQHNLAVSPWIDLVRAGVEGKPGRVIEIEGYQDLLFEDGVGIDIQVQWSPFDCLGGGTAEVGPFRESGNYYITLGPDCFGSGNEPFRLDLSDLIPPGATQVRIAIGVFSFCTSFPNICLSQGNASPYIDNVRFGVYGEPSAPLLVLEPEDGPQDAFPTDGTLGFASPGRVDRAARTKFEEAYSSLGDTLIVRGGLGGAEVRVQFAVDPGPGTDGTVLSQWLGNQRYEGAWRGLDWYSARIDTAERGGAHGTTSTNSAMTWMTTYHEEDPNFSGSDTDPDGFDPDLLGHNSRLANEVFPDDLLTPGSRLMLFYKARYLPTSPGYPGYDAWSTIPDTVGGTTLEMEILPSSMAADTSFNCVLYVNATEDPAAGPAVEAGLGSYYTGGSANFENTVWDRMDIPASGSMGRPVGSRYGATLDQLAKYRIILFDVGGGTSHFALTAGEAVVLRSWLTLSAPALPKISGLYFSGDLLVSAAQNAASTGNPFPADLLSEVCGVDPVCDAVHSYNCPAGTPADNSRCMGLAAVSIPPVAEPLGRGGGQVAAGNGCPDFRRFNVMGPSGSVVYGSPLPDETYEGPEKGSAEYASIANDFLVDPGPKLRRTVVDGVSVTRRRSAADCAGTDAVRQRLSEVLSFFGSTPTDPCPSDFPVSAVLGQSGEKPVTALLGFAPNPFRGGAAGTITFSLEETGPARVEIFDLAGRHVTTVFDARGIEGINTTHWDGRDDAGRAAATGVYFYRLRAAGKTFANRIVLLESARR